MSIDAMVARAITIEGYKNPVAYDESHLLEYGYWICTVCKSSFYPEFDETSSHKKDCSLEGRVSKGLPELIYVLGPSEYGILSPFRGDENHEEIEKIKALAKANALVKSQPTETKEEQPTETKGEKGSRSLAKGSEDKESYDKNETRMFLLNPQPFRAEVECRCPVM